MNKKILQAVTLTLVLGLTLSAPALAKKRSKKSKKAKAAKVTIATHPDKLEYGALDFAVPRAEDYRFELSNGIPVYVAQDHALPLISVSLSFRAGGFLDPEGKVGLASFTGSMMREGGAGSMTAEEFDERADFLAANISSGGGDTGSSASLNSITQVFDEALALFFEMVKKPRFQQDRIDVEKGNLLESLKQRNDQPAGIMSREWDFLLYGKNHLNARRMTEAHVNAMSREAMLEFHGNYWRPEGMVISVSGDITPEQAIAKLEPYFEGWTNEGPPIPWPPAPALGSAPSAGVYHVEKDIPQGRVRFGHRAVQRKSWNQDDLFAARVMNDILGGGGFTSRITKRIRSDEGLAYSAGSGFGVGLYWPGTFSVGFQTKSSTVALASKIALEEINRIRNEAVSAEELEVSKNSFIDTFPRNFESAGQVAGTFARDEFIGRPHEYWYDYQNKVRAVTIEDVQKAAKKYLDPEQLVLVIVGKWGEIEKGDPDGKASMKEFHEGKVTQIPLRDPLTLE